MTDKGHTAAGGALTLERLVFFSDAVMAIAITLLIIEIHVPKLPTGASDAEFGRELAHLAPNFFAYALSFLVIGLFWAGHHRIFDRADHYSPKLMWPNLLFLMSIAFMPFATALMGANGARFVPSLVYNLTLLASAATLLWVAVRVRSHGGALGTENILRSASTVAAAMLCVALCWVDPRFSQLGMLLAFAGPAFARAMQRRAPAAA